jgi:hypothetical protein
MQMTVFMRHAKGFQQKPTENKLFALHDKYSIEKGFFKKILYNF